MLHLLCVTFVTFFSTMAQNLIEIWKENATKICISWNIAFLGTFVAFEAAFPRGNSPGVHVSTVLFLYSVYALTFTAVIAGYWILALNLMQSLNFALAERARERAWRQKHQQLILEYQRLCGG